MLRIVGPHSAGSPGAVGALLMRRSGLLASARRDLT
jgi:hypothetical protein